MCVEFAAVSSCGMPNIVTDACPMRRRGPAVLPGWYLSTILVARIYSAAGDLFRSGACLTDGECGDHVRSFDGLARLSVPLRCRRRGHIHFVGCFILWGQGIQAVLGFKIIARNRACIRVCLQGRGPVVMRLGYFLSSCAPWVPFFGIA